MLATTAERVTENTAQEVNDRIRHQIEANLAYYAAAGSEAISQRLDELDREWDVERYVETLAPTFTLIGLCLGVTINKRWLLLSAVIQSFFLQHALQGWCPPIPLLRQLGIRTMDEINQERYGLKALRGDFQQISPSTNEIASNVAHLMTAIIK